MDKIIMLKNFSQPFSHKSTHLILLVEDETTGQFLLTKPLDEEDDYYYDGIYSPLHLEIDKSNDLVLELTKFLYQLGLSILSFRELTALNWVEFSLADETPGSVTKTICVHVSVDVRQSKLDSSLVALPLQEASELLTEYGVKTLNAGLAQLEFERKQK